MVEQDFLEVVRFKGLDESRGKAYTHLKKKNRWRDSMSPLDILLSDTTKIDPGILNLPPPILEDFYRHPLWQRGGYLVGNAVMFSQLSSCPPRRYVLSWHVPDVA